MPQRLTTNEFKQQLNSEHPELELLSDYKGNKEYVTVRCIKHNNIFNTKPNWLHRGCGCQLCYDERRGKTLTKSKSDFISEISKIYKGKNYDFSKIEYYGNKKKVCIICPKHGEFWLRPDKIITRKSICPQCSAEFCGVKRRLTKNEFLIKAREVHGFKFDYTKSNYITTDTPICITCPKHGEFWQTPESHLQGHGCPQCCESQLEKKVKEILKSKNIIFESQKHFDWLGKKSLDFFIDALNVGIECQGEQHFKNVDFFGGLKGFDSRVINDIAKNEECNEHGIRIIYIVDDLSKVNYKDRKFNGIYKNSIIELCNFTNFLNFQI